MLFFMFAAVTIFFSLKRDVSKYDSRDYTTKGAKLFRTALRFFNVRINKYDLFSCKEKLQALMIP